MVDYRICSRCVMDTTDPNITFDSHGQCNHCKKAEPRGDQKKRALERLLADIQREGLGRRYDCIAGVSGGVDSSNAVYHAKKLGLRPLAVHVDNGWNTEASTRNVRQLIDRLGLDLYTHTLDWGEFRDLQLSFLKASTPDAEIPTDHAIQAVLYQVAAREGVRYIIAGTNYNTESILPEAWSHGHSDWMYIKSVHRLFGSRTLKAFPHYTLVQYLDYKFRRRIRWINFLDYLDYVRADAVRELTDELGLHEYGGKHRESLYTKFLQGYILPEKFGFDKRRAHLSSLICAGQIDREQALAELRRPAYDPSEVEADMEYVIAKLGITHDQFKNLMSAPPKTFWDYPSYERDSLLYHLYRGAKSLYLRLRRR